MQVSARQEAAIFQVSHRRKSHSLSRCDNNEDGRLLPRPTGAHVSSQRRVATFAKGVTIRCRLRLALTADMNSEILHFEVARVYIKTGALWRLFCLAGSI